MLQNHLCANYWYDDHWHQAFHLGVLVLSLLFFDVPVTANEAWCHNSCTFLPRTPPTLEEECDGVCILSVNCSDCHRWSLRHIWRHVLEFSGFVSSLLFYPRRCSDVSPKVTPIKKWQHLSFVHFWHQLRQSWRCSPPLVWFCYAAGVCVMHSVAHTANAPLELPELKQQRSWLPANDHLASSATQLSLFPVFGDRCSPANPVFAIQDKIPTVNADRAWTVQYWRTRVLRKTVVNSLSQDKSASSSSLDSSGPWNQPDHLLGSKNAALPLYLSGLTAQKMSPCQSSTCSFG